MLQNIEVFAQENKSVISRGVIDTPTDQEFAFANSQIDLNKY